MEAGAVVALGSHPLVDPADVGVTVEAEDERSPQAEVASCRICLESVAPGDTGSLVLDCACAVGSSGTVHRECAARWFGQKGDATCDVCQQRIGNLRFVYTGAGAPPQRADDAAAAADDDDAALVIVRSWPGNARVRTARSTFALDLWTIVDASLCGAGVAVVLTAIFREALPDTRSGHSASMAVGVSVLYSIGTLPILVVFGPHASANAVWHLAQSLVVYAQAVLAVCLPALFATLLSQSYDDHSAVMLGTLNGVVAMLAVQSISWAYFARATSRVPLHP